MEKLERLAEKLAISERLLSLLDRVIPPVSNLVAKGRSQLIDIIVDKAPFSVVHGLFLSPHITHVLAALASVGLVAAVFNQVRRLNLFVFHPLFMSIGCVLLMTEGLLVYKNGALVSLFAPLMGGSSFKAKARSIHMALQIGGAFFLGCGLVFIAAHKASLHKPTAPASVHAWLGTAAALLVAVQAFVGPAKAASPVPVHRWHGGAGKLAYDAAMLAVLTGASSFLAYTAFNLLVLSAVALLWLCAQLQHTLAERKADGGGHSGGGGLGSSSHGGGGMESGGANNGSGERDPMLMFGDDDDGEGGS